MVTPNIIAPELQIEERNGRYLHGLYAQWRLDRERAFPAPPIENVRFAHDPRWRENAVFSIQAAADGKGVTWKIVTVLWVGAQVAFQIAPTLLRFF